MGVKRQDSQDVTPDLATKPASSALTANQGCTGNRAFEPGVDLGQWHCQKALSEGRLRLSRDDRPDHEQGPPCPLTREFHREMSRVVMAPRNREEDQVTRGAVRYQFRTPQRAAPEFWGTSGDRVIARLG
jgi:hypothetical protein